jgi:hypothetical protein
MKAKFYALLASAILISHAQASGHHGGGNFAVARPGPAVRGGAAPSFRSMPMRNFDGGRMIYSGQRFSPAGMRSTPPTALRPHSFNSSGGAPTRSSLFTPGNISRGNEVTRFSNRGNRTITNPRRDGNGAGQVRNGNTTLRADWRNHVFAQHSVNWHRDWDRSRDHWWHGHRCHFFNSSWFIFDFGFYPWWPYWYYPYDYYAYGYPYPYGYDSGYYDSGVYQDQVYYGQNGYADQYNDSSVAAVQERLAAEGYYRGEIDGVFGPATRRALARYQRDHGLRVTGHLTADTLQALGLRPVAS